MAIQIGKARVHKAWDGLRIYIPRMVISAAKIRDGDHVGMFIDQDKPTEIILRKVKA